MRGTTLTGPEGGTRHGTRPAALEVTLEIPGAKPSAGRLPGPRPAVNPTAGVRQAVASPGDGSPGVTAVTAPPAPRARRRAAGALRRTGGLLLLTVLLAATAGSDLPVGVSPGLAAPALPSLLVWLAPPAAVALLLGLLSAALFKEKSLVTDHSPVPPARNGEADYAAGVPVCGAVRHTDGSAVPRAALTLTDAAGRQSDRCVAGADGRYALSTQGPGAYVLIAAAPGHRPRAVGVTVQDCPVELDVLLGGAGRITGRVGTEDGDPVAEAVVTVTDGRGEVVANARSARDGSYQVEGLVAGEYTLAVGAHACRPTALTVAVHGHEPTRQDVELAGGAVLRGTVRSAAGLPVTDARVTLLDATGSVVDTAVTGTDGRFAFTGLEPGEYTVIAAGYPPVATVLTVSGEERAEHDLLLGHESFGGTNPTPHSGWNGRPGPEY